ncbi:hypothetical protein, partial [Methanosarcina mazei]
KEKNEEARVHFIPYLKEGVFVTLCAPVVIKITPVMHLKICLNKHQVVSLSQISSLKKRWSDVISYL